jgi:nitroreductase
LLSQRDHRREVFGAQAAELLDRGEVRRLADDGSAAFAPELPERLTRLGAEHVADLLRRRRSVRDYADRPVRRDHLAEICASGSQASAVLATAPGRLAVSAHWLVFARRVDGLQPGVHSYDASGGFSLVADPPDDRSWARAVQPEFVDAPCLLLPVWELESALRERGTDGYFNLLLATGSSLYVSWLTALDLGLSGCLLRDLHPALLSATVALGGVDARPFLTLALGHPPEPTDTTDSGQAGDPS